MGEGRPRPGRLGPHERAGAVRHVRDGRRLTQLSISVLVLVHTYTSYL